MLMGVCPTAGKAGSPQSANSKSVISAPLLRVMGFSSYLALPGRMGWPSERAARSAVFRTGYAGMALQPGCQPLEARPGLRVAAAADYVPVRVAQNGRTVAG